MIDPGSRNAERALEWVANLWVAVVRWVHWHRLTIENKYTDLFHDSEYGTPGVIERRARKIANGAIAEWQPFCGGSLALTVPTESASTFGRRRSPVL